MTYPAEHPPSRPAAHAGYGIVRTTDDTPTVCEAFARLSCLRFVSFVAPSRLAALQRFVEKERAAHELAFLSRFGFPLSDAVRLQAFLACEDPNHSVYDSLSADLKHLVRGELPLSTRIAPALRTICDESRLIDLLRAILRSSVIRMHHPPSVRVSRPGLESSLVPLHRDASYVTHLEQFITVWVPLCEIDDAVGGLEIVSSGVEPAATAEQRRGIWLAPESTAPEAARTPIQCLPGDVIVFAPQLLHASRRNRSTQVRTSIDYRFFPASQPTSKHYYDLERRLVVAPEAD